MPGAAPEPATLDGGGEGKQADKAAICTWYFSPLWMPSILFTILGGGGGGAPGVAFCEIVAMGYRPSATL